MVCGKGSTASCVVQHPIAQKRSRVWSVMADVGGLYIDTADGCDGCSICNAIFSAPKGWL